MRLKFEVKKCGYTLIEFLVVIGILSLSVGSILLILTSVIKGSNQTNITAEVKQNGQNVLDSLQSQVRGASDVVGLIPFDLTPLGAISGIWVTTSTGEKLTIICVDSSVSNNGWIGIVKDPVNTAAPHAIIGEFQSITNRDAVSGVDIDCTTDSFKVGSPTTSVKVVIIDFMANQGVSAPSRVDFKTNAQFKTVMSLRLY